MAQDAPQLSAMYDPVRRRRGVRKGREKGCWVYIPADELVQTGYLEDDPPDYRVWAGPRGRVVVQLYRREEA